MDLLINTATELKEVHLGSEGNWSTLSWSANERDLDKLLPSIDELLGYKGKEYADLKMIYTLTGPGSFTSLRLGIATVNTLVQALKIPVKAINTAKFFSNRLKETPAVVLLKAGGDQVHYFNKGDYQTTLKLGAWLLANPEVNLIGADFTAKLDKIWIGAKPKTKKLVCADWLELSLNWSNLEQQFKLQDWPIAPKYFKEPSIS